MARGSSMFPAALWPVLVERQVKPASRWLFACLYLHPETDAAGLFAWQPRQLATLTGMEPGQVDDAADHLQEKQLLLVDRPMERAWLVPFIEYDTSAKPNMYVAAMRSIRVCTSPCLKAAAWAEVKRLHPPPLNLKSSTPEDTRQRLVAEREAEYEKLEASVKRDHPTVREPFDNRSRTIAEPPAVPVPAPVREAVVKESNGAMCPQCHKHPSAGNPDYPGWCGACIQRDREHLKRKADRITQEAYDQ
jgi:hypothetical protein